SHFRSAEARREGRALRRDRKSPWLGQQGPAAGDQGQYGCHGKNDTARPAGFREDHRVRSGHSKASVLLSAFGVKRTCRERRQRADLTKMTHLRHWPPILAVMHNGAFSATMG